jgi:hypothetical protein
MLVLYSTLGCHLCELAEEQLAAFPALDIQFLDIADSHVLVQEYGVRIPVLKNEITQEELGWPFNMQQLTLWLKRQRLLS